LIDACVTPPPAAAEVPDELLLATAEAELLLATAEAELLLVAAAELELLLLLLPQAAVPTAKIPMTVA
jgi:hypothetical protein